MALSFQAYHPFLTYNASDKLFRQPDGRLAASSRMNSLLNDDASELWHVGKTAFAALPKFQDKDAFDKAFAEHTAIIGEFYEGLIDANVYQKIVFHDGNGKVVKPDLSDKRSSTILDILWQITRRDVKECGYLAPHFLFACLEEIDHSLIALALDNGALHAAISAVNAFGNYLAIQSGDDNLQRARSELAMQGATARHRNDPKQAERKFVWECWNAWQVKPDLYKSKAGFGRDMLDKCEHLSSQKKIEDWCRLWESDARL